MEGWIVAASIITAIAGLIAAGGAIWLATLNRQLVQASQGQVRASQQQVNESQRQVSASLDQVRISQEQVRVSQDEVSTSREQVAVGQQQVRLAQEQLSSQQRPILAPAGSPHFKESDARFLKWEENEQTLGIRNFGNGTAFNVASVLYGCASYLHADSTGANYARSPAWHNPHWTCWHGVPIAPGEAVGSTHLLGNGAFRQGNDHIGEHSFNAPDEEIPGTTAPEGVLLRVARVTITYKDISGQKHASIFDYVRDRGWYMVAVTPSIDRDLCELEGRHPGEPQLAPSS